MKHRAKIDIVLLSLVMVSLFVAWRPSGAVGQQQAPTFPAQKTTTVEWVYRVKYGHKEEWFRIFKKYQIAILQKQKELGYVKEFTVFAPSLHTSEESHWDYRIVIVRGSQDASPGQSEGELATRLFPDQEEFNKEEKRRWELTTNHWDLPIHVVDLNKPE